MSPNKTIGNPSGPICIDGECPCQAHNGFIDLALELGCLGLLIFGLPYLLYLRRALVWGLAKPSPLRLWPVAFMVFLAVVSSAESRLVRHNVIWALYVAAVITVEQSRTRESGRGSYRSAPKLQREARASNFSSDPGAKAEAKRWLY